MSTTPPPNDPADDTTQVSSGDPLGGATPPPPSSPPPPAARRLTRARDDRVIAGVCGGVARYFGIDPVIARIVAIALVFFGGAGALLYLAAVLLVPSEGEAGAPPPDRNRWLVVLGVVAVVCVVGPFVAAPVFIAGALLFPLAFVVIAALVAAWLATGRWPERDVKPIAKATGLGLVVLTVLLLAAAGSFWGAAAGGDEVVAGLVIAAGAAVLAGAFLKPVRWLIPLALALAIPTGFVAAAGIDIDGGIGEKRYRPADVADVRDQYEIGIGELVVDLRGTDLREGEDRQIDIDVGMGHALLLVDKGVCVATRADVGAGQVDVFDVGNGGVDIAVDDMPRARAGSPRVVVNGDIGLGYLEVAHEDLSDGAFEHRDRGENSGCVGA